MTTDDSVISDFLDGETFDSRALAEALGDPAGRDLLIDSIVLRYAAQADDLAIPATRPAQRGSGRFLWAAAAVLVALAGGYQLGYSNREVGSSGEPPSAARVVTVDWRPVTDEGTK
jgi:hypothetical protein